MTIWRKMMRSKRKIVFLAVVLGLLLTVGPAMVLALPRPGHYFYGSVYIGGEPAPEGAIVSAEIEGVEYARATVNADGQYGLDDPDCLTVPADDLDTTAEKEGGVAGETVHFYINGVEAAETCIFESGGTTELDLNVEVMRLYLPIVVNNATMP